MATTRKRDARGRYLPANRPVVIRTPTATVGSRMFLKHAPIPRLLPTKDQILARQVVASADRGGSNGHRRV